MNKSAWKTVTFASVALAAACGGSSQKTLGDDGDEAGAGGDAGTGRGGQSGTSNGGSSGSAFGGSSVGGSSDGGTIAVGGTVAVGGSSTGGTIAVGGSSTGGIGTSGTPGTGGSAGAVGICALPLVSGNCDAYFPSFGFSAADGNCQPFVYGGCGGNDNRFSTLAECEARCGGTLSTCPAARPMTGSSCEQNGKVCTYDFDDCLCSPTRMLSCPKIDEACRILRPDAGMSEIIGVFYTACTCTNGAWNCQLVTTGG